MRVLVILASTLFLASPLAAQPTRPEPLGVRVVSTDIYRTTSDGFGNYTTRYAGANRAWTPYVGDRVVSEREFYRHAGADHLARKVISTNRRRWAITGLGVAAMGVGGLILQGHRNRNPDAQGEDFYGTATYTTGFSFIMGGLSMSAIGLYSMRNHATTASQAVQVAETFNEHYGH